MKENPYRKKKLRKAADKILRNKVFNIAKNSKYDGSQHGLVSVVYKFFNKKTSVGTATLAKKSEMENEIISNKELAEELHEPIITNIDKTEVHSPFIENNAINK